MDTWIQGSSEVQKIAQNIILPLCTVCYLTLPLKMGDSGEHGTEKYVWQHSSIHSKL